MRFKTARTLGALMLTGSLCLSISSCRSRHQSLIAVIPATTAQEVWEAAHAGAEHAAQEAGYTTYWNGPNREDDLPRQIQIVNEQTARGAAGLVLAPIHSVALISPVRAALAKHIPTVVIYSPLSLEPGGQLAYIVNNDETMGRLLAERLAPQLKPGDTVAILGNNPAILSHAARSNAIQRELKARVAGIQIVERYVTSLGFDEAEQITEEALHSVPHLRAVIALHLNQTRASQFALRNVPTDHPILLLGCDQDLDLVRHVRLGAIDSLVAEDTYTMGYEAVRTIDRLRHHLPVEARRIVEPVLVTQDNVDQPAIQHILDMDWRVR